MSIRPRCRTRYKYGSFNLLAGADYRVSDSFVLGGAISYSDTHSDYDQSLGNVKAATTGVAGYGTYYVDNWYVDGFVAYGYVDYDSTRNIFIPSNSAVPAINTSATAKPKGDQWSVSIGVGRNFDSGGDDHYADGPARVHLGEEQGLLGKRACQRPRACRRFAHHPVAAVGAGRQGQHECEHLDRGIRPVLYRRTGCMSSRTTTPSIVSKYVNDPFNTFFVIPTANPTRDYAVLTLGSTATFPNNFSGFLHFSAAAGTAGRDQLRSRSWRAQAVLTCIHVLSCGHGKAVQPEIYGRRDRAFPAAQGACPDACMRYRRCPPATIWRTLLLR